jgi:hypothetical protein
LDELARQSVDQRDLLEQMAESWRNDMARNREDTLAAIRETANEQVPYNVQGVSYLSPAVPTPTHSANSTSTSSASLLPTRFECF